MKRAFSIGLIFSLALHLMLVGVVLFYAKRAVLPPMPKVVTIDILDQPPAKPVSVVKPEKRESPKVESRQVVEQDPSINNEAPDNARFLGEHNQKVVKQTQAANQGAFQNLKSKNTKLGKKAIPNKKSAPTIDKLLSDYDPLSNAMKRQEKKTDQDAKDSSEHGGDVSKSAYLGKEVDQGIETLLNTREFKYFTYYNRIRKQLSQYWEPKVREKMSTMLKQGRTVASAQDRITKLMIVLNAQGTLVTVQVLSDSGVRDLDDAAVEAFRAAAPFPNPPKGIIDSDGTVKIRWDFVLET